jgi:hypothetical protein
VHVYAYAYQTISLGSLGVLSSHFLMLSSWSFTCMFAIVPFFQPFQLFRIRAAANSGSPLRKDLVFLGNFAFAALLFVIAATLLRHPYGSEHYRPAKLAVGPLAVALVRRCGACGFSHQEAARIGLRHIHAWLAPDCASLRIPHTGAGAFVPGRPRTDSAHPRGVPAQLFARKRIDRCRNAIPRLCRHDLARRQGDRRRRRLSGVKLLSQTLRRDVLSVAVERSDAEEYGE